MDRCPPAARLLRLRGSGPRIAWSGHDRILSQPSSGGVLSSARCDAAPGPYAVQAEIAACHARAASVKDTDWERIAAL